MSYKIFILFLTTFATILSTVKMPWGYQQQASAQTVAKNNTQRVIFIPPKNAQPQPKNTEGGASRNDGKCPQDSAINSPYLTAVTPSQNKALTTLTTPTLLVYVPATSAQKAFFSISQVNPQPENQDNHYQTFLPIENKSGVMQLTLPEDAPELEIGKTYKWSFVLLCNGRLKPDSPRVEGMIERVSVNADFNQKLETASCLEKAVLYGQGGLWYDSVASFVKVYQKDSDNYNLVSMWKNLLSSEAVGLEDLASQPLLK